MEKSIAAASTHLIFTHVNMSMKLLHEASRISIDFFHPDKLLSLPSHYNITLGKFSPARAPSAFFLFFYFFFFRKCFFLDGGVISQSPNKAALGFLRHVSKAALSLGLSLYSHIVIFMISQYFSGPSDSRRPGNCIYLHTSCVIKPLSSN